MMGSSKVHFKKRFLVSVLAVSFPLLAKADFMLDPDVIPSEVHPAPAVSMAPASAPALAPVQPARALIAQGDQVAAHSDVPDSPDLLNKYAALTFVGDPPSEQPRLDGWNTKARLLDALQQIAPRGWHAYIKSDTAKRFDKDKLVDWEGNRPWVDVLDALAVEQGLQIQVDWTMRRLMIVVNPSAPVLSTSDKAPVTAPPKVYWVAKAGMSLRDAVSDWAQKAGWQLRWVPDDLDYPIIGDLTYEGSFKDAISGIFNAFDKAPRPMLVDGNPMQKLLVVTEKK